MATMLDHRVKSAPPHRMNQRSQAAAADPALPGRQRRPLRGGAEGASGWTIHLADSTAASRSSVPGTRSSFG
jgi:hypothetical protein